MPRLTTRNVIDLARAACHHLIGRESPPIDIEDFQRRSRTPVPVYPVVLYVFGPRVGSFPSKYARLWAVGESDYVTTAYGGQRVELVTLERSLIARLADNPYCDLVLVMHERTGCVDDDDAWDVDFDFRICADRAMQVKAEQDQAAKMRAARDEKRRARERPVRV
jgi:hypothetical protein